MAFPDIPDDRPARIAAKEHEKLRFQRAIVVHPCADEDAPAAKYFPDSSYVNHD